MGSFFTGGTEQPKAESYASVQKEAVEALIEALGGMYAADSEYSKLFNALYRQNQSAALEGYNKDYWNTQLDALDYDKQYANQILNYQKLYGNDYLKAQIADLKAADPDYWENYEAQGQQVLEDLNKGAELSEAQTRAVQQATRAGQAARGNAYGNANAALEVYNQFMAGEKMAQQRQAAAQSFLQSSPFNSMNIGAITAYTPQVSTSGYSTLAPYVMSNANAAASANAQYTANNYRLKNGWEMLEYNEPSAFISMVSGGINGAASGALSGAMVGGPWGAVAGGIIGGVSGGVMGAFSK